MLELRDVSAGYDGVAVLRNVTVAVPAGKVVALLGPNGAGKTTLLRVASRMRDVSTGCVRLEDESVSHLSAHRLVRAGVCHVPEGRSIFPALTVAENVAMFAGRRRDARESLEVVTREFPALTPLVKRVAGTLSGGEQQMLALSRAFVTDPKIVLLDEVSLGLAPRIVDELFLALRRLAATGVALLLVEQYVERALELADHAYLLNRGRVSYDGPPEGLDVTSILQSYVGLEA